MENIKIMFKSSRFVVGFCCVFLVVLFSLIWPLINTNDPRASRLPNPLYEEINPLRAALEAHDDAAIDEELEKLSSHEEPDVIAMLDEVRAALEAGATDSALSGSKQVKKSNPLYEEFADLRAALEAGDVDGALAALTVLEAHHAAIVEITGLAESGDMAGALEKMQADPALAQELTALSDALTAGDAALAAEEAATVLENHEKTYKWVTEIGNRLDAGGYAAALEVTAGIQPDYLIEKDQPPSKNFPLGTDNFSTDMLLKLAYGTRASLYVGLLAGCIATIIGLVFGLLAGYVGGVVDNILTTITNMFIVIPSMIVLILISVALGTTSSMTVTGIIIGLTSWPWTARGVRAQTTSLRNRDHVNMARITGYSTPHIILTEILPYIASYAVMAFILQMAAGITSEATLTLIGLGDPTMVTLGKLLNWAIAMDAIILGRWWQFVPVAGCIAMITFGLYMMNSGMDEVFNPKIRS